MQKERLAEEFTTALNEFQDTQRLAYQKEREEVQRSRAHSHGIPPPPTNRKQDTFGKYKIIFFRF
jgi:hypothetical protein